MTPIDQLHRNPGYWRGRAGVRWAAYLESMAESDAEATRLYETKAAELERYGNAH